VNLSHTTIMDVAVIRALDNHLAVPV